MEGLLTNIPVYIVAALLLVWLLRASLRIVKEYERGVIFRLGRGYGRERARPVLVDPIYRSDAAG